MSPKPKIETAFESGLFASRWLMAPMYLGLAISLAMLTVVFTKELIYYASKTFTMKYDEAILAALTLIDMSLAANLLVIVLFSGYENFVSKFDIDTGTDRPNGTAAGVFREKTRQFQNLPDVWRTGPGGCAALRVLWGKAVW